MAIRLIQNGFRLTNDEPNFTQAMRVLCSHGLVEVVASSEQEMESKGYQMHSCVHSWTIHVLNQGWNYEMARLALRCVGSHVPDENSPQFRVTQRRVLQHTAQSWYFVPDSLVREEGIKSAAGCLGNLYLKQGKLDEAEKMYQRAL